MVGDPGSPCGLGEVSGSARAGTARRLTPSRGDDQEWGEDLGGGAVLDRGAATDQSIPQVEGAARRSTSMGT